MSTSPSVHSDSSQPQFDPELHEVAHVVHQEFDGQLDPRAVDECLSQVAARFHDAPVRSFVPLLVGRYTREELRTRLSGRRGMSD